MGPRKTGFLIRGIYPPVSRYIVKFLEGGNLTTRIEEIVDNGESRGVELLVFTDNLVSESVLYKGKSIIPLLFEIVLMLQQLHMRRELIFNVIHIARTQMIEAGIEGLSRSNNLGGITIALKPLQFLSLDQIAAARSAKLESCIRTCWGESLSSLSAKYWFEHKGGNVLWDTPLAAAQTALEIL